MIKHEEFDFKVRVPEVKAKCQHDGCERLGEWSVSAVDAFKGQFILFYENVCGLHVIAAFLEATNKEAVDI